MLRCLSSLLFSEGVFSLSNDCVEGCLVVYNEVSKNLTVDVNVSRFCTFDKTRVGQSFCTDTSADTLNPETTECSLTFFTVTVLVLTCLEDSVFRITV